MWDAIIIGAGAAGLATARTLGDMAGAFESGLRAAREVPGHPS